MAATASPSAGSAAQALAVLAAGALFGAGLTLAGMVRPEVVLSFLRAQDFGLMLVMGGAMGLALLAYRVAPRALAAPLLGGRFGQHVATLDRDTVLGAALFGVGWGLCGVCPGPAIAALGTGNLRIVWALVGIAAGAGLHGWWMARRKA